MVTVCIYSMFPPYGTQCVPYAGIFKGHRPLNGSLRVFPSVFS